MNRYEVKGSLLRAVNQAHPELAFNIQVGDVTFGAPELYLQGQCNSRLLLTAQASSDHFKDQGYVFYNRRRLDEYLVGLRVPGVASDYSNTQAVVAALAKAYGLPLDPLDFTFAGVSGRSVTLKPLDRCVGFFTNFSATLAFMGTKPYVGVDVKFYTAEWQNTSTTQPNTTFLRRSMVVATPGATPYLGGGLSQHTFAIGDNPAVELRGFETGEDTLNSIPAYMWVSVQFFGQVDSADLSNIIELNGVIGTFVAGGYNTGLDMTFLTYRMDSNIKKAAGAVQSISF